MQLLVTVDLTFNLVRVREVFSPIEHGRTETPHHIAMTATEALHVAELLTKAAKELGTANASQPGPQAPLRLANQRVQGQAGMTETQAENLAVEITALFIPLDVPDSELLNRDDLYTLDSINFAEKASEVAGILLDKVNGTAALLLEALKLLKEDFVDSEGCYCGQIVGGTKDGEPLGICGYCKANAAIGKAEGTANASQPAPQAPSGDEK